MLKSAGGEMNVKLIDFGLSCFFTSYKDEGKQEILQKMKTKAGTLFFMAPEVLTHEYNFKCDVWSLGVILYIMLCGYPPFAAEDEDDTCQLIVQRSYEFDDDVWDLASDEVKDLLGRIFQPEDKRILPKKILTHAWLKKFAENDDVECSQFNPSIIKLNKFQKTTKFRQTIMSYMANRTNDDEIENEKKLFQKMDRNNDGYITKKEFQKVNDESSLGYNVDQVFENLDLDHNGAINYNEFLAASLNDKVAKDPNKIRNAFNYFDVNKDGTISKEDIKN